MTASSRAIPMCDKQSPRFEGTSTSSTKSSPRSSTASTARPTLVSRSLMSAGGSVVPVNSCSQLQEINISRLNRLDAGLVRRIERTSPASKRRKGNYSPKLFQKPEVEFEEQSNIIELINPCAGAINPESEGKTGEL